MIDINRGRIADISFRQRCADTSRYVGLIEINEIISGDTEISMSLFVPRFYDNYNLLILAFNASVLRLTVCRLNGNPEVLIRN